MVQRETGGARPVPRRQAQRIFVVGTTGSGKTTVARQLATAYALPHVELDALYWGPAWTPLPATLFRARVAAAVAGEQWVVDGNYRAGQDILWPRATTVVWLDYPLPVVLWQLWWRTLRRVFQREVLWNGNRERFGTQFFSRTSLFLWALQTPFQAPADLSAPNGSTGVCPSQGVPVSHAWGDPGLA